MKNLLKSVMLVLFVMPLIGCESEPIENVNHDQSRLSFENSLTAEIATCESLQSFAKFVNYGSYVTDFQVYDSEANLLVREVLTPDNSSDLKPIPSVKEVTVVIRNSENTFSMTVSMNKCMLYSFTIDESETFTIYKYQL